MNESMGKNSPKTEDELLFITGGILCRNRCCLHLGSLLRVRWNRGNERQRKERPESERIEATGLVEAGRGRREVVGDG